MKTKIAITGFASISTLGSEIDSIWKNYTQKKSCIQKKNINHQDVLVASIPIEVADEITRLRNSDNKYKNLDNSVLFAILISRKAVATAKWTKADFFGINIGSSRGATELFEKHHEEFIKTNKVTTLASPTTTLGNLSSWVSHDLQAKGPEVSHSITCSTSLHALLNGIAWLQAGMVDKFLVGGTEAPLTPFTIAQMQALGIYSKNESEFPCQALNLSKKQNTLVIGEGAAVICIENGVKENAIAYIEGIGYATEILEHNVSISTEAECFQKSMLMAIEGINLNEIDAIVMHAPGTIKGDQSEFRAIEKVFGNNIPLLTTNKWKIGHTFGSSGMLSLELAILMLQNNTLIESPFYPNKKPTTPLKKILVNAVGFGGNAVSVVVSI